MPGTTRPWSAPAWVTSRSTRPPGSSEWWRVPQFPSLSRLSQVLGQRLCREATLLVCHSTRGLDPRCQKHVPPRSCDSQMWLRTSQTSPEDLCSLQLISEDAGPLPGPERLEGRPHLLAGSPAPVGRVCLQFLAAGQLLNLNGGTAAHGPGQNHGTSYGRFHNSHF